MSDHYRPSGFGGFSFFPPVIKNLLIINAVIFLIQMLGEKIAASSGLTLSDILTKYFSLIPIGGYVAGTIGNPKLVEWAFYPWQLITYQFMHGSFSHILFNMFSLWMFGIEVENYWGSKKFLYFLFDLRCCAGLCHMFISPLLGEIGSSNNRRIRCNLWCAGSFRFVIPKQTNLSVLLYSG